ncbi:MAG: ABC transporter ATP-binding protein [Clostridiales bacterium]|jgi:ABC-2 type transport system ATP-binding protein|nr:ABC transporter ATP-binding protein [Clostridiales bacterium]
MNTLEVKGINKQFGKGNKVLSDVSFTLEKGEILAFLGPNGAGKSTTMNIITGYIFPDSGEVLVEGIDVFKEPYKAHKLIGYLPEQPPLYNGMTVWEYLKFVYQLKKSSLPRNQHLTEVMELVNITDVKNKLIKNLSKGYRQRVGIAQALIGNPLLLILDEPTVGLDPRQIVEVRECIAELAKDRTIILSSHIMQEVEAIATKVVVIDQGVIVADGTLAEVAGNKGLEDVFLGLTGADGVAARMKEKAEQEAKQAKEAKATDEADISNLTEEEIEQMVQKLLKKKATFGEADKEFIDEMIDIISEDDVSEAISKKKEKAGAKKVEEKPKPKPKPKPRAKTTDKAKASNGSKTSKTSKTDGAKKSSKKPNKGGEK